MLSYHGATMFAQEVQDTCAQILFRYGEDTLPIEAQAFMAQAIVYACVFGTDLLPDRAEGPSMILSWIKSYKGEFDVLSFGEYLKDADTLIKQSITDRANPIPEGKYAGYERLKHSITHGREHLRHLAIIKPEVERASRDGDVAAFGVCNSWINFLRRVNLPGLDLEEQMLKEYVQLEEEMANWSYDQNDIYRLNSIIRGWFQDFDLRAFLPKHGPGAVAGSRRGTPLHCKYELCRASDARLRYLEKDIGAIESWLPWGSSETVASTNYAVHASRQPLDRCSELVAVPKSIISNRTISKEPAVLQYFQQGYSAAIRDYVSHHKYLRRHINFNDQDVSRDMAWEGSICGKYATIDLSSASDTVTTVLVRGAFAHTGALLRGLLCTRSDSTLLFGKTKERLKLNKFAPMGSALCFPVETIMFAACCEYAAEETAVANGGYRRGKRIIQYEWRVYGDDIIVDTDMVPELLEILDRLHFRVNATKSFTVAGLSGNFREACGIECLDGKDVTPLRIPRFFRGVNGANMLDADAVSGAMSLANNAFDFGAWNLRHQIIKDMQYRSKNVIWDEDGSTGLKTWSYACTNWHVPRRYRSTAQPNDERTVYQRSEYKAMTMRSVRDCESCLRLSRGFPWFEGCSACRISGVELEEAPYREYSTNTVRVIHAKPVFGESPENNLQEAVEYCRYHEWLKRYASTACCTGAPCADESARICPVVPTLRSSWIYDPRSAPKGTKLSRAAL